MKFKFCSCRHCRSGLHASKYGKSIYKRAKRKGRQMKRIMLLKGDWENLPEKMSVPYTA